MREYATTQDVDRFLSSPVALTPELSTRSLVRFRMHEKFIFPFVHIVADSGYAARRYAADEPGSWLRTRYWLRFIVVFSYPVHRYIIRLALRYEERPLDSSSPRVDTPDGHSAPTVGRERLCLFGYTFSSF